MNLILKNDPVWIGSLKSLSSSHTLLLLGGDGLQVEVPAPLLLAVSPLVRRILTDLLPPAYSQYCLSLPDATEEVLKVMADVLVTGSTGGEHVDKMEDVRQVFEILEVEVSLVSCHLESIALDRSIKVENSSGGPYEENIKKEVNVESEDKNRADFIVEVEQSKRLGGKSYSNKVIKFACNICSKQHTSKPHLMRHIKSFHNIIRFPCHLCPQKFGQKCTLVSHIRSVHDKIKFPCNLCPQKFTEKSKLVRHIRAVHDKTKFPCNLCPKQYTQKDSLVRHIGIVHTK